MSLRGDLAGELATQILTGDLQPGDELPSETKMAADRGISRTTVRASYSDLRSRGLVVSRPGALTVVARRTLLLINVTRTANRVARSQLETLGADSWVHDVTSIGLDAQEIGPQLFGGEAGELAGPLQIGAHEHVIIRELERQVDGIPHNVARWVFPRWLAAGTKLNLPDSIEGGSIPYLSGIGYGPDHFEVEFETRMPSRAEQGKLQMPDGVPLQITYRTGYHLATPVYVEMTLWRGDQTRLRMET